MNYIIVRVHRSNCNKCWSLHMFSILPSTLNHYEFNIRVLCTFTYLCLWKHSNDQGLGFMLDTGREGTSRLSLKRYYTLMDSCLQLCSPAQLLDQTLAFARHPPPRSFSPAGFWPRRRASAAPPHSLLDIRTLFCVLFCSWRQKQRREHRQCGQHPECRQRTEHGEHQRSKRTAAPRRSSRQHPQGTSIDGVRHSGNFFSTSEHKYIPRSLDDQIIMRERMSCKKATVREVQPFLFPHLEVNGFFIRFCLDNKDG